VWSGENSWEIKGGGQEMAAMMLMLINFNNQPPLISKLFLPSLFKLHHFFELGCF